MAEAFAEDEGQGDSYYAILNVAKDASTEDVRRAYRNLAQVFHPDKHTDANLKAGAQETFRKLQEAHEVLSDVHKRQVYDVYGRQGLMAGFEVGPHLAGLSELKKQWEEFKKKQEAERQEALSNHRGAYVCRIDATDLRLAMEGRAPLFRAIAISNSIDTPVGEGGDAIHLMGQAALRGQAGTGNLICGYKRVISQNDSLDTTLVLGLRSLISVTSTRQLTPYTSASISGTYSVHDGLGLQLNTTRQLPGDATATFTYVLGPPSAAGMSLVIARRGTKYGLSGKVEVGSVTSISLRATYVLTESINLRAIARFGTTGIDLEVGAAKRFSPQAQAYLGTVVGLQGVLLKTRYVRGGQTFEIPVLLSSQYSDWRVVSAAYILPPLLYLATSRLVVRPLNGWLRRRRDAAVWAEHAEAVTASLASAAVERGLLSPVARRKARAEAERKVAAAEAGGRGGPRSLTDKGVKGEEAKGRAGLVILKALYGELDGPLAKAEIGGGSSSSGATGGSKVSVTMQNGGTPTGAHGTSPAGRRANGPEASTSTAHAQPDAEDAEPSTSQQQQQSEGSSGRGSAGGAAGGQQMKLPKPPPGNTNLPQQWMSVAEALQYLVSDGRLQLHSGVSKSGLMGFADPAPGSEAKQLYVAYWHGGQVYEVTVGDTDGLELPRPSPPAPSKTGSTTAATDSSLGSSAGTSPPAGQQAPVVGVKAASDRASVLLDGARELWGLEPTWSEDGSCGLQMPPVTADGTS